MATPFETKVDGGGIAVFVYLVSCRKLLRSPKLLDGSKLRLTLTFTSRTRPDVGVAGPLDLEEGATPEMKEETGEIEETVETGEIEETGETGEIEEIEETGAKTGEALMRTEGKEGEVEAKEGLEVVLDEEVVLEEEGGARVAPTAISTRGNVLPTLRMKVISRL